MNVTAIIRLLFLIFLHISSYVEKLKLFFKENKSVFVFYKKSIVLFIKHLWFLDNLKKKVARRVKVKLMLKYYFGKSESTERY